MSTPINDGGPAFQVNLHEDVMRAMLLGTLSDKARHISKQCEGMSLRDWFAGMAMQAMCAGPGARMVADCDQRYDETNWKEVVASNAYDFADAMILQRSKPTTPKP